MNLHQSGALVSTDGRELEAASSSVTHLAVGAHPDDVELMAHHGIESCFGQEDLAFGAVILTDGSQPPRSEAFARLDAGEIRLLRRREQLAAAAVGRYAVTVMLDYPSAVVKTPGDMRVDEDLKEVFRATRPKVVYTHNPADKHPTHVAVVARVLRVLRSMPEKERPGELLACEAWRGLDWVPDDRKRVLFTGRREHLAAALLGCFDSQIAFGKRYDLAGLGRRRANATFLRPDAVDDSSMATYALDLTALMRDAARTLDSFVEELIDEMGARVRKELQPWT